MKKSELKTGMVVTLRNGAKGIVFKDTCSDYLRNLKANSDVIVGFNEGDLIWESFDSYNEDMLSCDDEYRWMDIVKVETVEHPYDFIKTFNEKKIAKAIFKREPDENEKFLKWLENEFAKHFVVSKSKVKSVNELIYTLRMSENDYCINLIDGNGGCVCIPSAKETFIPTRHLEKKIESIEYDTEEPEYPLVIVKTC